MTWPACLSVVCVRVQASFAFNVLEEALRLILEKMEDLSSLAAETARLAGLLEALRAADVDAGGDGTVVGFGGLNSQHHSSRRGGSGQGGRDQAAAQHSSKDGSSDVSDMELADRSETALLLHGTDSSSGTVGAGGGSARLSRVLRLMEGSEPGLEVDGLTACVPGRHHQATVVCQDLSFKLQPGELGERGCRFDRPACVSSSVVSMQRACTQRTHHAQLGLTCLRAYVRAHARSCLACRRIPAGDGSLRLL